MTERERIEQLRSDAIDTVYRCDAILETERPTAFFTQIEADGTSSTIDVFRNEAREYVIKVAGIYTPSQLAELAKTVLDRG